MTHINYYMYPESFDGGNSEERDKVVLVQTTHQGAKTLRDSLHPDFVLEEVPEGVIPVAQKTVMNLSTELENSSDVLVKTDDCVPHDNVVILVEDEEGKVLIFDSAKFFVNSPPMGKVDQGETLMRAAERELFEETGYDNATYIHLLHLTSMPEPHIYRYNGANVPVTHHYFRCKVRRCDFRNIEPLKHRSVSWLSKAELANLKRKSVALKWALATGAL